MNDKEMINVPFVVYESATEKADRQQKRLIIIIAILIGLLFLSNVAWVIAWCSYDYVDEYTVDVDADDGGNANYIGGDGDINNGSSNSETEKVQDA